MAQVAAADLGSFLRDLRRGAGITQEALAERMNVAHTYVSQVERGISQPSWKYLVSFADAIGTSVVSLLRRAGLLENVPEELEQEMAELAATVPEFEEIFRLAREYPEKLPEVVQYARYITERLKKLEPGG